MVVPSVACPECGGQMLLYSSVTCEGDRGRAFTDDGGRFHVHPDIELTYHVRCLEGHQWTLVRRLGCDVEGCDVETVDSINEAG